MIGRDAELGLLRAALDRLEANGPVGLLVEGPAGIGKSTIWTAAATIARDRGWLVLVAHPAESESQLTLGTLADLLGSVDDSALEALPAPQRRALDVALLRAEPDRAAAGAPPEARLLGTAARNLLAGLAAQRPVVLAVDDVQWIDRASATAIAFAARRLEGSRVGLLLAHRTPQPLPFDADGVMPADSWTRVEVGPMPLGSINELLRQRGRPTRSRASLVRIEQASGGNPLFALEIARVLERTGEPPAGEPLPVPADIRDLLRDRLAAMSEPARAVLLDLAILGSTDVARLAAVEGRDVRDVLVAAERDGLVRTAGAVVTFAHPLYAAAAVAAAGSEDRRAAHGRIAATAGSAEERARHRALASDAPDDAIAAALDTAAAEARRRAAPVAAAELLQLAIERTPPADGTAVARRRLALGEELKRAGDTTGAIRELELVAGDDQPRMRARAKLKLAAIRYETDVASTAAVRLATEALHDAAGDPELEAHAYGVLGSVDWDNPGNKDRYVVEGERRLAEVVDPDPEVEGILLGIRCGSDFRNGRPLDPERIRRGLELEAIAPAAAVSDRFSASLGTWLKLLDRFDEARIWLERTRQTAIDEGDEGSLPYALAHLPELEVWTGHWDRAEQAAREHLALAEASGFESQRSQALYNLALVHVHQGREAEARAEIAEALTLTEAAGDLWMQSGVLPSLGLLELSLGHPATAVGPLERAWEIRNQLGVAAPTRPAPDLVEALAACGSLQRAAEVQDELDRRVEAFHRPSHRATAARSRGLLLAANGRLEESRAALEEALVLHDAAPIAFDRARTLLALGQVRRRLRERGAAADAFRQAQEIFEGLGARLWADRAAAELERTGLRRGAGPELTAAERRVAELAASGMTNRQVAAALFISPKTVDANLGRAYAKLGIRSRAELGAVIGGQAGDRTNMGDPPM